MVELAVIPALLLGLAGGVHCAAMCGGIASAISWRGAGVARQTIPLRVREPKPNLSRLMAYNAGRVGSYALAGLVAGSLGAAVLLQDLVPMRALLYVLASLMLIAQGLYLAGAWNGIARIERAAGRLWKLIEPRSRRLLPVDSIAKAAALGALWGWLPCGLVYSALTIAVASADPLHGALAMLAFGLGTLPNLLAIGFTAAKARPLLQDTRFRRAAAMLIISFGVIGLVRAIYPAHEHVALSLDGTSHVRAGH